MADIDFLAFCHPGTILQTRDRREARITDIDPQRCIISGSVQMMGPCRWRADGRFADAPAGAAGPLDLLPPPAGMRGGDGGDGKHALLRDALQNPATRGDCCD